MVKLRVRRWQKYGHDRLFVETENGIKVGWFDLRTQKHHLNQPGMWPEFQQAVNDWRKLPKPAAQQRRSTRPNQTRDLAGNVAGEALQQRAEQLQPQHSVLRVLARAFRIKTADYAWRTGAKGEQKVASKLDPLKRRGWHVLHSIDLGMGGDVDHLVIGPAGVFTINTKHHPSAKVIVGGKAILVRGKPQPYVVKASREAQRVRIALSAALSRPVHVAPVIVMHGQRSLSGWMSKRPQGVYVLPSWAVAWWCRLPGQAKLSAELIDEIYSVARRSSTWTNV